MRAVKTLKFITEKSALYVEVFQVLFVDMAKYNGMDHAERAECMFRTEPAIKSPIQHSENCQE